MFLKVCSAVEEDCGDELCPLDPNATITKRAAVREYFPQTLLGTGELMWTPTWRLWHAVYQVLRDGRLMITEGKAAGQNYTLHPTRGRTAYP